MPTFGCGTKKASLTLDGSNALCLRDAAKEKRPTPRKFGECITNTTEKDVGLTHCGQRSNKQQQRAGALFCIFASWSAQESLLLSVFYV